jgi:hypothetical protein
MISTYDLALLGCLISLGGIGFLFRGYRRHSITSRRAILTGMQNGTEEIHADQRRVEITAGVRWLTVGALILFIGSTRGAESGYIFGLWTDVPFHVGLLSVCWFATLYRLKNVPGRKKPVPNPLPASVAADRLETTG